MNKSLLYFVANAKTVVFFLIYTAKTHFCKIMNNSTANSLMTTISATEDF